MIDMPPRTSFSAPVTPQPSLSNSPDSFLNVSICVNGEDKGSYAFTPAMVAQLVEECKRNDQSKFNLLPLPSDLNDYTEKDLMRHVRESFSKGTSLGNTDLSWIHASILGKMDSQSVLNILYEKRPDFFTYSFEVEKLESQAIADISKFMKFYFAKKESPEVSAKLAVFLLESDIFFGSHLKIKDNSTQDLEELFNFFTREDIPALKSIKALSLFCTSPQMENPQSFFSGLACLKNLTELTTKNLVVSTHSMSESLPVLKQLQKANFDIKKGVYIPLSTLVPKLKELSLTFESELEITMFEDIFLMPDLEKLTLSRYLDRFTRDTLDIPFNLVNKVGQKLREIKLTLLTNETSNKTSYKLKPSIKLLESIAGFCKENNVLVEIPDFNDAFNYESLAELAKAQKIDLRNTGSRIASPSLEDFKALGDFESRTDIQSLVFLGHTLFVNFKPKLVAKGGIIAALKV